MNRDDIIRMARECADNTDGFGFAFYISSLERFAALIAAAEADRQCPNCADYKAMYLKVRDELATLQQRFE
jgi:hypothetical protein